jgi:hypothetical protein
MREELKKKSRGDPSQTTTDVKCVGDNVFHSFTIQRIRSSSTDRLGAALQQTRKAIRGRSSLCLTSTLLVTTRTKLIAMGQAFFDNGDRKHSLTVTFYPPESLGLYPLESTFSEIVAYINKTHSATFN